MVAMRTCGVSTAYKSLQNKPYPALSVGRGAFNSLIDVVPLALQFTGKAHITIAIVSS